MYFIDQFNKDDNEILNVSIEYYVNNYIESNKLPLYLKKNIFNHKFNDIKFNIENSPELLNNITNNSINIKDLPWVEPYRLNSELWKTLLDKQEHNKIIKEGMTTINTFKCKKCGENKCTSYQVQIRSIDEPMTTFIRCKVCGNTWNII